jgi:hypothetical protein
MSDYRAWQAEYPIWSTFVTFLFALELLSLFVALLAGQWAWLSETVAIIGWMGLYVRADSRLVALVKARS